LALLQSSNCFAAYPSPSTQFLCLLLQAMLSFTQYFSPLSQACLPTEQTHLLLLQSLNIPTQSSYYLARGGCYLHRDGCNLPQGLQTKDADDLSL